MRTAAFNSDTDEVKQLFLQRRVKVEDEDMLGMTALMYAAAFNRNAAATSAFLEAGSDTADTTINGWLVLTRKSEISMGIPFSCRQPEENSLSQ